jgi:pyridoxamine 5'-phosphate oxidase-like protein
MDANRYMTLATAGREGRPWASPVFYATGDYAEFYWISPPGAAHSRNLVQRPDISIVIFDSRVAAGTGQAVYMSATARQVADGDVGRALAVYPGPADPGPPVTAEQVREPAPYRLYQATVREWWVLCPRDAGKCVRHGLASDHRVRVDVLAGR